MDNLLGIFITIVGGVFCFLCVYVVLDTVWVTRPEHSLEVGRC